MRRITVFLILALGGSNAFAADMCATAGNFSLWLQCHLKEAPEDSIIAQQTQQTPNKQTEGPSVSSSSTSLVDHTSLADFLTAGLNVAGFGDSSNQSTAGTSTVSAFAIYSAVKGQSPTDNQFYNAHPNWRLFTFSVGTSGGATSTTSSSTTTSSTSKPSNGNSSSRVVGASLLIVNHRDLATKGNQKQLKDLAQKAMDMSALLAKCEDDIEQNVLMAVYEPKLYGNKADGLQQAERMNEMKNFSTDNGKKVLAWLNTDPQVTAILNKYPAYETVQNAIESTVLDMQKASQLSISGQASIADIKTQASDYRAQIAFEKGLTNQFDFTANGSFDYVNNSKPGADTRGGRAAIDLQYQFQTPKSVSRTAAKKSVSLDLSGEGDWFQSYKPSYVGQIKLTIPLLPGVDLPFSFSYASTASLLHEAQAVGKFGLTFDLSVIAAAIAKH